MKTTADELHGLGFYDPETQALTECKKEGDALIVKKSFDDTLTLDTAQEMRATSAGNKWGNGFTHVGFIPQWQVERMMRDGTLNNRGAIKAFFKAAPAFCTFEKYLK
jgi:hypothetical protein